jgi:hypothetical protein
MFRLMQHSTRESDDVPDWLKGKIECPARPEGMRVKDCPKDPKFLEYFGKAIRALGERFDNDPTLAFMDISLPGAWGEGSHVDWFTEEQLKRFLILYSPFLEESFYSRIVVQISQVVFILFHFLSILTRIFKHTSDADCFTLFNPLDHCTEISHHNLVLIIYLNLVVCVQLAPKSHCVTKNKD